jgi:hypothetical protein
MKTWKEAFEKQQSTKAKYDNTGITEIDDIPFTVGNVVWVIMAKGSQLYDYEEWATEYGAKEDGMWCALSDGHCSCYGWEAEENTITEYDSLEQLLKADKGAAVIVEYRQQLLDAYPFLEIGEGYP